MEDKIKVLIQIDVRNIITAIGSDIFIADTSDWIMIDEGYGDKYAHAQNHYFDNPLFDAQGLSNYIYENDSVRLLTDTEKNALFPAAEPEPTEIEVLQQENHLLKAQINVLTEQGEFQDDLIAELATIVYA